MQAGVIVGVTEYNCSERIPVSSLSSLFLHSINNHDQGLIFNDLRWKYVTVAIEEVIQSYLTHGSLKSKFDFYCANFGDISKFICASEIMV